MIPAGILRHRITIEQYTVTGRNVIGGEVKEWVPVATVWAAVEPIRGREFFAAHQVNAEVTTRIRIRYLPGVAPTMRVQFGNRTYDIRTVIDVDERHLELQLMCVEKVTANASST